MNILSVIGDNKFWNIQDKGCGMAHHNVCGGTHARRGVHSVMAHSGFGAMSLVIGDKRVVLPAAALTKKGLVKKSWANAVSKRDIEALVSKGATIAVA